MSDVPLEAAQVIVETALLLNETMARASSHYARTVRFLFMEQQYEGLEIPASHDGWEIEMSQPNRGPYGRETAIALGRRDGVELQGVAWDPRVAWSILREMIRQRATS